jgi:undecaprenyl diphosphate synthase
MASKGRSAIDSSEASTREYAQSHGVDLTRLPSHIAIIMDGNGRWAQKRGLPRLLGHRRGYKTVQEIVRFSTDVGISTLTLYVFSVENWRRPMDEVSGLMSLIEHAIKEQLRELHKNGVRVTFCGRIDQLPDSLREALLTGMETTRNNTRLTLNLAINYGGRAEIVDAAKSLAREAAAGALDPESIDDNAISSRLYTAALPDPDLLIRTAGEMRVSNFLLWQIAYAEIYVTQSLWPDFTKDELITALIDYQKRIRKFGGIEKK